MARAGDSIPSLGHTPIAVTDRAEYRNHNKRYGGHFRARYSIQEYGDADYPAAKYRLFLPWQWKYDEYGKSNYSKQGKKPPNEDATE